MGSSGGSLTNNKVEATFYDPRKPCGGTNVNICVAEGCYGEACLKYNRQYTPDQFSGQDTPLFDFGANGETDFPVKNQNDFPVRKRFSGRFFGDLGMGLLYLLLGAAMLTMAACAASIVAIGVYAWWQVLMQYPLWTTLITGATLLAYAGCVKAARMERVKHEQRR